MMPLVRDAAGQADHAASALGSQPIVEEPDPARAIWGREELEAGSVAVGFGSEEDEGDRLIVIMGTARGIRGHGGLLLVSGYGLG